MEISIWNKGILKILKKYKPKEAICEYIWNWFDAGADTVCINFIWNEELWYIEQLIITDNWGWINYGKLEEKFKPFMESNKVKNTDLTEVKHHSLSHWKNGVWRLTFFAFAWLAKWETRFKEEKSGKYFEYALSIDSVELKRIYPEAPTETINIDTGTKVIFENIQITTDDFKNEIYHYLQVEYWWFLELYKDKKILINGEPLDYSSIIVQRDSEKCEFNSIEFTIDYIQWESELNTEVSKKYYLSSLGEERWKDFTGLNRGGDDFHHSLYITSTLFDDFQFEQSKQKKRKASSTQFWLLSKTKADPEWDFINTKIKEFLNNKRSPFLKNASIKLIEEYEAEGIFPEIHNSWETERQVWLKQLVSELYTVKPTLFVSLNHEQKAIFVNLLNEMLDNTERDTLLFIIDKVLWLSKEDKSTFVGLLWNIQLSSIISTVKLLENRYKIIEGLKDIVFKKELKANEKDHIQIIINENYWIFWDWYQMVVSTEWKFQKALEQYLSILWIDSQWAQVTHPDKNKEMDIFICKQLLGWNVDNIIVELKHPLLGLGEDELSQVKTYMRTILATDMFNSTTAKWKYYLIGNRFNQNGYMDWEIESKKSQGDSGLVFENNNTRIYVKTWSTLFDEFECKYKLMSERLNIKRSVLSIEGGAKEITQEIVAIETQ